MGEYRTEAKEHDDVPTWEPPVKKRRWRIVVVKRTDSEIDAVITHMESVLLAKEEELKIDDENRKNTPRTLEGSLSWLYEPDER